MLWPMCQSLFPAVTHLHAHGLVLLQRKRPPSNGEVGSTRPRPQLRPSLLP